METLNGKNHGKESCTKIIVRLQVFLSPDRVSSPRVLRTTCRIHAHRTLAWSPRLESSSLPEIPFELHERVLTRQWKLMEWTSWSWVVSTWISWSSKVLQDAIITMPFKMSLRVKITSGNICFSQYIHWSREPSCFIRKKRETTTYARATSEFARADSRP